uniref:Uncharacterized protein n=1 Tax=Coccidioides posadasii RMSCC 3488 TaxID=454284 RepID=A0A0J6FPG7_COCPO|nr:hypothetical protein CPAG_07647 [Coccidioides posadasii RMSCC 3488]
MVGIRASSFDRPTQTPIAVKDTYTARKDQQWTERRSNYGHSGSLSRV